MSEDKGFYVDVCFDDGKYDWLAPGLVNGVTFPEVEGVITEIEIDPREFFEWDSPGVWIVKYFVSNITFEQGQMSLPETGQWDFPPHFEFEVKRISSENIDNY